MKSINLVCKVEIESALKTVVNKLMEFTKKENTHNYTINICVNFENKENDFPNNVKINQTKENQHIEDLVNEIMCSTTQECVVCCSLDDDNWEYKITRIVENLEEGVEVCKISMLSAPVNPWIKIKNFFIKMYLCFVNMFIDKNRNMNFTDINFQGFSSQAIKIMANLKKEMFLFRCTNAFLLMKQKIIFIKPNKNSERVKHLLKRKITKNQIISLCVFGVGLLFIALSFPLLLNLYIKTGSVFKFVIFNLLIFATSFLYFFINYFQDEVEKFVF